MPWAFHVIHHRKPKDIPKGYNLGISSLIEAILKNQFRHVSLAESGTWSGVKFSGNKANYGHIMNE